MRIFRYRNSKKKIKLDEKNDAKLIEKLENDPDYKELMILWHG
jgi:hypothetical protein